MTAGIPVITLAGKEYPVPPLVPKQLKHVIPAIMQSASSFVNIRDITTESFTKLLTVIYWGIIWPNDPNRNELGKNIKFDVVEEMAIGLDDIMAAVRLVQKQTGLFRQLPQFVVTWESLTAVASEWRAQQNRPAIDDANPANNEDIQGALGLLAARSVKAADAPGEA